jgi:hypothetical protein
VLPILLHKTLEELFGHDHVPVPREVDAEDVPVHGLDGDPDPRLERPHLDEGLIDQEGWNALDLEDLSRLIALHPAPDCHVTPPASSAERFQSTGYVPEAQTQKI